MRPWLRGADGMGRIDRIWKQFASATLSGFLTFAAGVAHAEDTIPQTIEAAHALVSDADALAKKGDFASAVPKTRLVLTSPVFSKLTAEDQYDVWWTIGSAEVGDKNYRAAQDMLNRAIASPVVRGRALTELLFVDQRLEDTDGVRLLTDIAKRAPKLLPYINPRLVTWAAEKSVTMSDRDTIELIGALRAANWRDDEEWDEAPDVISIYLARAYLDGGDAKSAAAAIADVTSTAALISMRSEKLFDPVVAMDPSHFDIAKAAETQVTKYRERTQAKPDSLAALFFLTAALTEDNHPAEALAVADTALARVKSTGNGSSSFKDTGSTLARMMEARAQALYALGRVQEALDQMTIAAGVPDSGEQNVDQLIDLAVYDVAADKPRDALKTLVQLNPQNTAPYGFMVAADARVCAYAALHDAKNMQAQLRYMQVHKDDAPMILLNAYLCAGDLDDAAVVTIQQIRDPLTRSHILANLQDYSSDDIPSMLKDGHMLKSLRTRQDVQAVITEIAHIGTYPIRAPDF